MFAIVQYVWWPKTPRQVGLIAQKRNRVQIYTILDIVFKFQFNHIRFHREAGRANFGEKVE